LNQAIQGVAVRWFEHLEQKRSLLTGGTVLICLAMLAVTVRRNNLSFDSFWHLQMGLDWIQHGLSLWRDHFSFTYSGEEVNSPPYLFQVFLGWLVLQFGFDTGFEIFKFGAFLLAFTLLIVYLRQLRAPVVVYILVLPLVVVLFQLRSIVRPELISYSFSILAIMLYYRARNGMSARNMLPVVGLMLLWGNYHTPIFGYIIFFGLFIDVALQQIKDRCTADRWLIWLGWGLAIIAVGFLRPGFHHPIINMLMFSPEWKKLILEYQTPILYREIAAVYSLMAITALTMVLLLWKRHFGLLFVCVFLSYFSIEMARLVTPSGIVILCIFAWVVSELDLGQLLQRWPKSMNRATGWAVAGLFVLSLSSSVSLARSFMDENKSSGLVFPKDVVDYMLDQGISGRIFNEYGMGGYLIYRLSPDSQVYIDGRTGILYPLSHFYRQMDAERSPEILNTEIEKYDINLALLKITQRNFAVASDSGKLGLDYLGFKYALFRRDEPNFPVLGTLLAYPACWSSDMSPALEEEQEKAFRFPTDNPAFLPFIQFVIDYGSSKDRSAFLDSLEEGNEWSTPMLRFAAYQALIHDKDSMAFELFAGITDKDFSDYLGGAMAKSRLGEWAMAEQLLDTATRSSWSENTTEISILHYLLVQIRMNASLELFDDAYLDRLAGDIGLGNDATSSAGPAPVSFCPPGLAGNLES
jgi:hypothetical protein